VRLIPFGIERPPFGTSGVNQRFFSSISSTFLVKSLLPAALFPFWAGVPAIGVGQLGRALAVGDDENPLPFVRRADFFR